MADFLECILLLITCLLSIIVFRSILSKTRTAGHIPPSPLALPIIGHLHLLAPIPHQALNNLSNRYGPLIHLYLGSIHCVVASSPEMAKVILKTHEISFSNRMESIAIDFLTYGKADMLFAPMGPYWKFIKKLCVSELLGSRMLDQFRFVRREEINHLLHLLMKKAKAGESVDMGSEFVRLTNNVVSRMTMSQRCTESDNEAKMVKQLVHEIVELAAKFNFSDFIWFCKNLDLQGFRKKLKGVHERFDAMMERIINEREEARMKRKETGDGGEVAKDMLDMLLDISKDENSEMKLTRDNIKAFILDIFVAGTDTTTVTMEWALAELINHPNIMEKARQEIHSIVRKNRLVEESDVANLPYLQAIAKETLRLHPAGPLIFRQSAQKCSIEGYEIPANTRVYVNVWAIGRDPKYWENPLEFHPERFLNEEGSEKNQLDVRGQHFHLLPFGSGRRVCPGISLALQVVQTSLANMIQCFDFKVGNTRDGTVDMEEKLSLSLMRAHPLVCFPVARLNPFPSI